MSLRFRISDRSRLGRRLAGVDEAARKEHFERIVEMGLEAVDGDAGGSLADLLTKALTILEALDRRATMLDARLVQVFDALQRGTSARESTSGSSAQVDAAVSDDELQTLIRTLDGLGSDRQPAQHI